MKLYSLLLAAAIAFIAAPACGQAYPTKPLRLIVPFAPGGLADVMARGIAKTFGEGLGQTIVVENQGGAGSTLGTALAAKAPADGYTLLLGYSSGLTIAPGLYGNLPYDPVTSFTPIGTVARFYMVMVAHTSLPVATLPELVEHAKRNPGKITYGSPGVGSSIHLLGEVLRSQAGVDLTHVPYKGMRPALVDLAAGRLDLTWDGTDALVPLIKGGRIKPLAVLAPRRLAEFPDVPAVQEVGYPDLAAPVWTALLAPAGLAPEIAGRLEAELAKAYKAAELQQLFRSRGLEMFPGTPAQLTALMKTEIPRWSAVIKASGAKPE
jgi:tripartite-type tricarboxylate transporter receptor subunit TctC